jgi:hypothetical protein
VNHQLDGARLKIVRAQEHLDSLKSEIETYLKENPYEIISEKQAENTWTVRIRVKVEPPLRFSALIGDCVTNARAALDHTVWQLAIRHFVPPLVDTDRKWVSWPIYATATDQPYISKINGFANRKMPVLAIHEIKRAHHQCAAYEPLWWLHELVNEDKHRMPLLTIAGISSFGLTFSQATSVSAIQRRAGGIYISASSVTSISSPSHFTSNSVALQSGAMHVDGQASVFVALQDVAMPREPVERTLEQIIETVANVIPRFEQFFA